MQDRPWDAQLGGCASDAEVGCKVKVCSGDVEGFLSQPLSIGPRTCQPSPHPLHDTRSLELRVLVEEVVWQATDTQLNRQAGVKRNIQVIVDELEG